MGEIRYGNFEAKFGLKNINEALDSACNRMIAVYKHRTNSEEMKKTIYNILEKVEDEIKDLHFRVDPKTLEDLETLIQGEVIKIEINGISKDSENQALNHILSFLTKNSNQTIKKEPGKTDSNLTIE